MEHDNNVIIDKKLKIMAIVLYGYKNTETEIIFFEKAVKFHEELINDEDENDIMYLNERIIYFDNLFNEYAVKNNTDQVLEKSMMNNSTFVKTTLWLD